MAVKLRLVFSITIFFLCYYGVAQTAYWKKGNSNTPEAQQQLTRLEVRDAQVFSLDRDLFTNTLKGGFAQRRQQVVSFPDENGVLRHFAIRESPVLSPELSRKYPGIKSYVGYGLDNNGERIRFSVSHNGIQSMIVHANGKRATYMQKISTTTNDYMVYNRESGFGAPSDFICSTKAKIGAQGRVATLNLVDGQVLRKFRLAVSATGEYTQFHGGTVADALAGINATITRVNEIFETDLGISLELIPDNDKVIYTNKNTDPYGINLIAETQNTLNTVIGVANYDVGHLFHKEFNGGNAGYVGSVCIDSQKGSAYSSAVTPQGDNFDIDFVSHELGHQFGANHTWSFESEGTLVQAEPGSGSTIMGYAGISGNQNVTLHGEDYFHYYSIFQISEYIGAIGCGQSIPIINTPPQIMPLTSYTIPRSTAFILTGSATDVDVGNILTYNWEQINNGVVTQSSFGPTNVSGANFRSLRPTLTPSRYFPRLGNIVAGNLTQTNPNTNNTWETVSDVARELDFALTVRDNGLGGGQVTSELMKITVTDQAGPFRVTSQTTNETYSAGSKQEVTWDVANTDRAPVNVQKVDIYYSTNGGASFLIKVADGVPNNGSHEVLVPGFATPTARIMVKAHDNVFLAVNAADFTIAPSEIVLDFPQLQFEACIGSDLTVPFTYRTFDGFYEEATFSATDIPTGLGVTFSPVSEIENDSLVNVTFSNTSLVAPGNYPITITATTATVTKSVVIDLNLLDNSLGDVALQLPANGATEVGIAPRLEWEPDASYTSYGIEIAEDVDFINIIEVANSIFNHHIPTSLLEGSTYYWRVKPKSDCGEGTFGQPYSFTTLNLDCASQAATDLPLAISNRGTSTVTSKIFLLNDLPIADINVNLDLTHSFLSDLEITLVSPSGTRVVLVSSSCGGNRNINATFDNDADSFICGNLPAISGTVRPLGSLGAFKGESTFGEWKLEVKDLS
ncbi:MAG TPA: zinc-dependent metalloprotease family protein, partial [Arenibacter sp.]|nr:zinc-dependent metalloprotease family protein [Arenibacter sp.]